MKFLCVMEEGGYISDKYGVKWAFKALIKMSATSARGFHLSFLTCLRLYAALQESRFLCCRRFSRFLHLSRLLHPGVPQGWCFLPLRKFITWLQPSSMLASHSGLKRLISALECFAVSWGGRPDTKAYAISTAGSKMHSAFSIRQTHIDWIQNGIHVCLVASLRIDEVFVQESNNRCLCACKAAAGWERPALRVSRFETDMGELLFSGLTPNLLLMDRPPNSQLL